MQGSCGLVVTADVKGVSVERTGTSAKKVIRQVGVNWCWVELQDFHSRRRQPAHGNQITGKWSAVRASIRISCAGIINLAVTDTHFSKVLAQIAVTRCCSAGGQNRLRRNRYVVGDATGLPSSLVIAEV